MFGESQRGHLRLSTFEGELAFAVAVAPAAAAGAILELEVVQERGEEEGVILDNFEILLSPPISVVFPAKSS